MRNWRRVLRWTLSGALLVPLAFCTGTAGLNYSGYCFDQARYLSDDELIASGIAGVLAHYSFIRFVPEEMPSLGRPAPSNQKNFRGSDAKGIEIAQEQLIPYRNAEEFLAVNPGCCNFGRRGMYGETDDTPLLWKVTGYSAGFFNARYQIRYRDAAGQAQSRWTGITFHYTNCGRGTQYYH